MKYIILSILFIYSTSLSAQPKNIIIANELAKRVVPQWSNNIVFEEIKSDSSKDVFEVEQLGNKILIRGNNANSMAVGLNYYLKNYCNVSVSWHKDYGVILPKSMPKVTSRYQGRARTSKRFFLNYCTFGYTMPWWKWADWQSFIDWMALNGINMPLAITGEEAVWYNVWKKFGFTDNQIRSYFTGPAYLPWHRMSNIDHFDGPLPQSWLDNQLALQKKIVARERELNMTPVLPAFAGHVPEFLKEKYPNVKITSLGRWAGFTEKYQSFFLDPFDSLFKPIQKAFLEEQTKLFGTGHVYGADPFNEVTPPSWKPDYLANVSKTIYQSMAAVDSDAQWVQMGWIFVNARKNWTDERIRAYLTAVPQNKMVMLDYWCDNTEVWKITNSFYGQPFIWCYLGNFGGNTMMTGNLNDVEIKMENTFQHGGDNLWGVGSTLEGFGNNPVMYQYVFNKVWAKGTVNTQQWINNWANSRYGQKNKDVDSAWEILLRSVYSHAVTGSQGTLTNARPCLYGHGLWTTTNNISYNNIDLLNAWRLLLKSSKETTKVFDFDVTNAGQQVLGNYFTVVRDEFTKAYEKKDIPGLEARGKEMMAILNDIDTLLSTNTAFLLGKWIQDARAFGKTPAEKNYYEADAKRILTTWGKGDDARELNEYANRSWAGLMKTYYDARWKMFIKDVIDAVKNNQPFDDKKFLKKVTDFAEAWINQKTKFSAQATPGCLKLNRKIFNKYQNKIQ